MPNRVKAMADKATQLLIGPFNFHQPIILSMTSQGYMEVNVYKMFSNQKKSEKKLIITIWMALVTLSLVIYRIKMGQSLFILSHLTISNTVFSISYYSQIS